VEQLHKIFKLCGSPSDDYWRKSKLRHSTVFKPTKPYRRHIEETFNYVHSVAIRLMETLLAIDPSQRGSALFPLKSEVLKSEAKMQKSTWKYAAINSLHSYAMWPRGLQSPYSENL
ncbi:probable serine/threonine-protein kinase, partial [Tanacetum coccineum]